VWYLIKGDDMKKLLIIAIILALAGCGKDEAPSVKSTGITYSALIEGISLPMSQIQNAVDGTAMSGNVKNNDGGLLTLYTAIDHGFVTKARLIIMPSEKGNLPSDAENLKTMLQVLNNAAPEWENRREWFVSAFSKAHENPNKKFTGIFKGNAFSVEESSELKSFDLEISPR
jgi:hypothetical protein